MRTIILPKTIRLFKRVRPDGSLLARAGFTAEAGVELEVGPVEVMVYDHMVKAVVSFQCKICPEIHYILVEETGLSSVLTN